MTNGRKSSLFCRVRKVAGDLGPTIAGYLKAFFGCSKPGRVGVTCPRNIPVRQPAGGAWPAGKSKVSGSTSGGRFCPNWTHEAHWTGKKVFWTPASLQLKRGLRSRQNQKRKRHEVDGGGRRLGCSFGKPTGLGQPGGSDPGRKHPAKDFRPAAAWTPAKETLARHCRPGIRQRSAAMAIVGKRHPVDRASSQRANQTLAQRWAGTAPLPQTMEGRTHLRLVGQLPPPPGKTRSPFACL